MPVSREVRRQDPDPPESVTLHEVNPSDTLTVPAGRPEAAVTATATVYGCPTFAGDGTMLVIVVVVDGRSAPIIA